MPSTRNSARLSAFCQCGTRISHLKSRAWFPGFSLKTCGYRLCVRMRRLGFAIARFVLFSTSSRQWTNFPFTATQPCFGQLNACQIQLTVRIQSHSAFCKNTVGNRAVSPLHERLSAVSVTLIPWRRDSVNRTSVFIGIRLYKVGHQRLAKFDTRRGSDSKPPASVIWRCSFDSFFAVRMPYILFSTFIWSSLSFFSISLRLHHPKPHVPGCVFGCIYHHQKYRL